MATLAETSLTPAERLVLERFAQRLSERFGDGVRAVWLFGSSARGEPRDPIESDVDVLVILDDASLERRNEAFDQLHPGAREVGHPDAAWAFSVHINSTEWLAQRREIESFFIAEVDRDKVVVAGVP